MKKKVRTAIYILIILGLLSVIAGIKLYNKPFRDLLQTKPDFTMSAAELQKEFESDEQQANEKYMNKTFEITGEIGSVKKEGNRITSIILKTDNDLSSVICTFRNELDEEKFKPGNTIKVRGEFSGFLMDVLLNNCVISH